MQPSFTDQEQTRVYDSVHYGWTAETRIKIDGKNWVITTSKRSSGGISTHCHAVQDEGGGSISFSMAFGDTPENFYLNIQRNVRCTEKAIRENHAEGMKQFYAKKEAGELPKLTEDEATKAAEEKRQYLSQFKKADRRTTTEIVKRHIRATWPAVQIVGVKTDVFSGGDSMDVTYHAPERIAELETFVKSFQEGHFDGMTDMYEYHDRPEIILEGHILQSYKFASSHFSKCDAKPITPVSAAPITSPGDVTISFNEAKGGIEIRFSSKPPQSTIDQLKRDGFRWSRFNSVWYIRDTAYNQKKAESYGILPKRNNIDAAAGYIDAQEDAAISNGHY